MRVSTVLLLLVLLATLMLAGCRMTPNTITTYRPRATPTEPVLYGKALYDQRCALCHGPQGEGTGKVGSSLASPEFLSAATDSFLYAGIAKGRPDTTMSPWEDNGMTPEQITSLVAYLRGWQTAPSVTLDDKPAVGDRTRGQALYAENCASCHGLDGRTGRDLTLQGTSIGNPVFLEAASDAFIAHAIAYGRGGTAMLAYGKERGGPLDAQAIADIVTFMRSWQTR